MQELLSHTKAECASNGRVGIFKKNWVKTVRLTPHKKGAQTLSVYRLPQG